MAHWANEAHYVKRRVQISLDWRTKLIKLWIAGKLLKLSFWLSPHLQKTYNNHVIEDFVARNELWL